MEKEKIFCIGFFKTGTTSLSKALRILGYNVVHGDSVQEPNFGDHGRTLLQHLEKNIEDSSIFSKYDAFLDAPYFAVWKKLVKKFPNAKFIFTIREEEQWLNSCLKYYENKNYFPARVWLFGPHINPAANEKAKNIWLSAYRKHNAEILDFFNNGPYQFLKLEITNGEGWEKLCPFLDKKKPSQVFPIENKFDASLNKKLVIEKNKTSLFSRFLSFYARNYKQKKVHIVLPILPKSRFWLSVFLKELLRREKGVSNFEYQTDGIKNNLDFDFTYTTIWDKEKKLKLKSKKVVFITRNFRDLAAISTTRFDLKNDKNKDANKESISLSKALKKLLNRLERINNEIQMVKSPALLIDYDKLLENPLDELNKLFDFLEWKPDPILVNACLDWAKYDNPYLWSDYGIFKDDIECQDNSEIRLNPKIYNSEILNIDIASRCFNEDEMNFIDAYQEQYLINKN